MKVRQIFIVLLLAVFLFSLVACGSKPDPDSSVAAPSQSGNKTADTAATGEGNNPTDGTEDSTPGATGSDETGETGSGATGATGTKPPATGSTGTKPPATTTTQAPVVENEEFYKSVDYTKIKGTTVTLLMFQAQYTELMKKQVKAFENQYRVTTKIYTTTWNDWVEQLATRVAAADVPDDIGISNERFYNWMANGLLQPVDKYFDGNDPMWSKAISDAFMWDGNHYGVGNLEIGNDPMMVVYNQSMFEREKVKSPKEYYDEGNWTFDTFKKCVENITKFGSDPDKPTVWGMGTPWRYWPILANGGSGVATNPAQRKIEISLGNAADAAGVNLIADLYKKKCYDPGNQNQTLFIQGKMAMVVERVWCVLAQYGARDKMKDKIGIVPVPKGPNTTKYVAPMLLTAQGIPKGAKNPLGGAAWQYFSHQYAEAHKNDAENIEVRRQNYDDEQYAMLQKYMSDKNTVIGNTFMYSMGNWMEVEWPFWSDVLIEKMSVQASLQKNKPDLQREVDKVLNKLNSLK